MIVILAGVASAAATQENREKPQFYSSSTSLSFLMTAGNAKNLTLGLDTEQNLNFGKNRLHFNGSIIYSESEGEKDSEIYSSLLEFKRTFSSQAYLLGFGRWERNVFSGYNHRLALSIGGGYIWTKSENWEFFSEAAFGWSQENNLRKEKDDSVSLSFASMMMAGTLKIRVSQTSEFIYNEMLFINLEKTKDYRLSSMLSLSVSISRSIALKLTYQLKHNHEPVPGFKNTDHYLLSSFVVNF